MAKQLRLLFFISVIAAIAVFVYLNFWKDYADMSVNTYTINSSFGDANVYIKQDVDTEYVVQNSHELTVKKMRARTRELIAEKLRSIDDMRRQQQYGHHANNHTFNYVTKHPRISKASLPLPTPVTPKARTPFHRGNFHHIRTLMSTDLPTIIVSGANCTALFLGNETEISKAGEFQSTHVKEGVIPIKFIQQAFNCTRFIAERRYAMWPVNREEEDFPIAFSILMFKDVEQFERLLRAIYRPQNLYCVHVDNKSSSDIHTAVKAITRCFDNVFILRPSIAVHWGYFSVLEPELRCMKKLLRRSKKWKYFINLTGQEFPLKTNWQIVRILKAFNGSNNMEGTVKRRNMDRFETKPPAPHNITVTKGSVHVVVVRAFVEYMIYSRSAADFLDWVKDTGIPDETFFSSLNHNPNLRAPGSYLGEPETDNDKYRFITRFKNWGNGPFDWPCHGKRVSMVCIFSIGDLPLLSTRPELFANKFYLDYEPLALDCMEQLHYRRLREEVLAGSAAEFNTSLYSAQEFTWNHV